MIEGIALFKVSSLLWAIAVNELMWGTNYIGVNLGHPIDGFVMGSSFYLAIIIPLSRTVSYFERKKRIPGLGATEPSRKRFLGVRRAVSPNL